MKRVISLIVVFALVVMLSGIALAGPDARLDTAKISGACVVEGLTKGFLGLFQRPVGDEPIIMDNVSIVDSPDMDKAAQELLSKGADIIKVHCPSPDQTGIMTLTYER